MVSTLRAETRIGLETFKINPEAILELTSKSMTFNSQTKKARFVDDVKVKYGQLNLSAQELIFLQSKSETGAYHLTFSATGPIIISNQNNYIYGDRAEFIGKKKELTISGNVSLNQQNNTIMGDKLTIDLENGIASITGSVKTTITPLE